MPSAEELEQLPHAELARLLAEAYRLIGRLQARVEELERQARGDSSNSSRPPSSDSPYKKKPRDRSLRQRGKRRPGKQPGEPGATMNLTDDPDERIEYSPAACQGCGTGLAGEPVLRQRRYQVTDITPPPPPKVTEYVAQLKRCPCCGAVSGPVLPARVRARASYGPEVHAQAANLAAGNFVPVARAVQLLAGLAGITVSTGWMAAVRGKAAALIEASGFPDAIRELLRSAAALHADETPARAAGGLRYLHVACTRYLTWMHTGDRSADAIDAGGILRGYTGVLVRDGYSGYSHLTTALHAWCAAHLLRDLAAVYDTEPALQQWAAGMGLLLLEARDHAAAARAAGKDRLDPDVLAGLITRYHAITAAGRALNRYRHTSANGRAARSLSRRFELYEDMILCFATRPDLDIFTNNEAERAIRPVKVQQRTSGGCWRTLQGLADFAIVQSYLSTAGKWGISTLDALRGLFNGTPWIPAALEPSP
ncbi:MAG TPA: IS66 family transposase [Streptosporangiaceae bacterium]|nr:IS66 family transposase [Streptosporangiaceae bacterium]